ncbi:MAG: aminodeoxychorismate/anthranilate synthase component II [Desulfobacterales bacterium]|nr:aminodeoxychorismate/anthranilate synthase component II [Desulfobacterales bacterium]MCP4163911.1 aminodeoxychorismate/anthranilate synthase component II [Deltaproteobacteria bacterium]
MILMIDNYDSFTYNIVQYIEQMGVNVNVIRNDKITIDEIRDLNPKAIVISPGPGRPETAGISLDVVKHFSGKIPLLGVCLGHQTIAQYFGSKIVSAKKLMHGKTSLIEADGEMLYKGIKKAFPAMRYHSLVVDKDKVPDCLKVTSKSDDGEIMGLRHIEHNTEGMQFHPESIMTNVGKRLLRNFLKNADILE